MNTAVLSDGMIYHIPAADLLFFKELAARMKWEIVGASKKSEEASSAKSWVDSFAGKWQDDRSADQIISDIHAAGTSNSEISL